MAHQIDNLGRGNCMYYAYAISLMHFLKKTKDDALIEEIFQRLGLEQKEAESLREILKTSQHLEIIPEPDELMCIQKILGPALRKFAAQSISNAYKQSPKDSSIFAVASFKIRQQLAKKSELLKTHIPENELIEKDGNLTAAELFKARGITENLERYANEIVTELEEALKAAVEPGAHQPPNATNKLDNLIGEKSVAFFLKDNYQNLGVYTSHIGKEGIWGSEETLMILNSALTGERQVRDSDGKCSRVVDFELPLAIYRDGQAPSYSHPFSKVWINRNPKEIEPSELRKLLQNKPAYVLFEGDIYYVGIENPMYVKKGPSINTIKDFETIDWISPDTSPKELEILSKAIAPRREDEHYLREGFYAIMLNNNGNMHWTSLIPVCYEKAQRDTKYHAKLTNWSLFSVGVAGGVIGEIINLALPNFIKNIELCLSCSPIMAQLAVIASVAIIFIALAGILNSNGISPPHLTCGFFSASKECVLSLMQKI